MLESSEADSLVCKDNVRVTTLNGNGVETTEEWTGRLMYGESNAEKWWPILKIKLRTRSMS
jgi:hypothetical protein